jgi:hypothetical protein
MAEDPIPAGPLEQEPAGPFIPHGERLMMLREALGEVELGAYDRRILNWLAGWDTSTIRTLVSLITRAKAAELAAARYGQHDQTTAAALPASAAGARAATAASTPNAPTAPPWIGASAPVSSHWTEP